MKVLFRYYFFAITLNGFYVTYCKSNKTTLHVGLLLEMSEYRYWRYVNLLPHILEYAFNESHKIPTLLPDYEFKMIIKDTAVS